MIGHNKALPLLVSGYVFGIIALAHLLRIIFKSDLIIASVNIPMEVSYIGFVITLLFSIWMFKSAKK